MTNSPYAFEKTFQLDLRPASSDAELAGQVANGVSQRPNRAECADPGPRTTALLLASLLVFAGLAACGPKPAATGGTSSADCTGLASWGRQGSSALTPFSTGLMAYDEQRNQVVMYGNRPPRSSDLGVTWTWNGTNWAEADRTGEFLAEFMVYDGKLGRIVALSFFTPTPEARLWNGSAWSPAINGGPMPPRARAAVAYDPVTGNVVVFGGKTEFPPATLGDTWTWDGSRWTQQHPATSPAPRYFATMWYDPSSRKLLLFGGFTSTGRSTETWSWDGSTWTQLGPRASPPPTDYLAATDPGSGAPLLIGQTPILSPAPSPFGSGPTAYRWEQWCWTGSTWQAQVVGVHPARVPAATAYDKTNRNTLVLVPPGSGEPSITTWSLK